MFKALRQSLMLAAFMFGYPSTAVADTQFELSSGVTQVALIELFTSEGCSSCPPADRWLTRLKTNPDLWKEFTPIAFHVDYWDYIGWQDKFAQAEFGARQRRYADEGGARFVYTPGLFLRGSEWHGWRTQRPVTGGAIEVGEFSLQISGEGVIATFTAKHDAYEQLILHVAILGMNIETRVGAGENNGKILHHDFVALGVSSVSFEKDDEKYHASLVLPVASLDPADRAIVAWVSDGARQAPIQSVGGFIAAR